MLAGMREIARSHRRCNLQKVSQLSFRSFQKIWLFTIMPCKGHFISHTFQPLSKKWNALPQSLKYTSGTQGRHTQARHWSMLGVLPIILFVWGMRWESRGSRLMYETEPSEVSRLALTHSENSHQQPFPHSTHEKPPHRPTRKLGSGRVMTNHYQLGVY